MLQTEFEFCLPRGYVDGDGNLHRTGTMRLSNAKDEILPLQDPRVRKNEAYLTVIVLSRVITKLGELADVNPGVIENLFSTDLAYLQDFYNKINEDGAVEYRANCPHCDREVRVNASELIEEPAFLA